MLMKRKLTRYLPAKKRKRNADGYYKALQRASKEMVDCSMLSHSSVRRKDEYSITTLGMSCLKIAKSVSAMLGKDGQRIIDNYEKVAEEVTSYERQP
jgi:predicted transcriptional regulator